jgi:S1-C subfamily serine protease
MRRSGLAAVVVSFVFVVSAPAQPNLNGIKSAVVKITIKGIDPTDSTQKVAQGTGFFISKDAYVVTSKHLLTGLESVDPQTVTYEIEYGAGLPRQAGYAWTDPNPTTDLLVLYVYAKDWNVPTLKRGTDEGVEPGVTPIYTGGFPKDIQYTVKTGFIQAWGVLAPIALWTTSFAYKEGQSGSPVCLADAKVIAVAKGNDAEDPTTGVVVPVKIIPNEFWDVVAQP